MEAFDRRQGALEGFDEAGRQALARGVFGGWSESEIRHRFGREAVELAHGVEEGAVAALADAVDQGLGLLESLAVVDRLAAPDQAFEDAPAVPGGELDDGKRRAHGLHDSAISARSSTGARSQRRTAWARTRRGRSRRG